MLMIPKKWQPKSLVKIKDVNNQSELQVKSHQHIHNAAIAKAEASAELKAQTSISTTAIAEVVDDDSDMDWMDEDECKSWDSLLIDVEDSDDEP